MEPSDFDEEAMHWSVAGQTWNLELGTAVRALVPECCASAATDFLSCLGPLEAERDLDKINECRAFFMVHISALVEQTQVAPDAKFGTNVAAKAKRCIDAIVKAFLQFIREPFFEDDGCNIGHQMENTHWNDNGFDKLITPTCGDPSYVAIYYHLTLSLNDRFGCGGTEEVGDDFRVFDKLSPMGSLIKYLASDAVSPVERATIVAALVATGDTWSVFADRTWSSSEGSASFLGWIPYNPYTAEEQFGIDHDPVPPLFRACEELNGNAFFIWEMQDDVWNLLEFFKKSGACPLTTSVLSTMWRVFVRDYETHHGDGTSEESPEDPRDLRRWIDTFVDSETAQCNFFGPAALRAGYRKLEIIQSWHRGLAHAACKKRLLKWYERACIRLGVDEWDGKRQKLNFDPEIRAMLS
tara:strand:- start:27 stop:1259 length:1233 start_codon:yes stop_codon:yes gene_type:complete